MLHLAYLQAVEDVNNRVSRLAANVSLIRENLCPISFVDVPERAYEESCERDLVLFNYDDPARHFYEVTELFVSQQLFTATDGLNADFDQYINLVATEMIQRPVACVNSDSCKDSALVGQKGE